VVGESGILTDPEDIPRIASEIKRVLTEPNYARDLSNRGLDRAAIFTWERTATKTTDVYKDILGAKRKD
jgi:glycosyltransferase involved in cell wall biosynthesis